jgi:hypothetical protein
MELVMQAVAGQPGVARVENLMHLPGEDPPNKAAVLHLSVAPADGSAMTG